MSLRTFQVRGREIPLWIWAFGYAEFLWHTLGPGALPLGTSSVLGAAVIFFYSSFTGGRAWVGEARSIVAEWRGLAGRGAWLEAGGYLLCFSLLLLSLTLGLFSSLRPPFPPQEYDAINYQMGVPRQLLLRQSLAWINWSVADLWPMAFQWGIAPLAFAFGTINKAPQLLFTLGTAACLYRLARQLFPENAFILPSTMPVLALLGAHGVSTQIGTGMMDLPLLYFLLLALSGLLDGRYLVSALSLSVYVASKAFHPFQVAAIVAGGLAWLMMVKGKQSAAPVALRFLPALAIFSLLLLLRSGYFSMNATGTPLFPFAACALTDAELCAPQTKQILDDSAKELLATRDAYGLGRTPAAFLKHLWRVAVPINGVNNEYDYPLGLPWLLLMILLLFSALRRRWHPVAHLTVLFWALWWLNAHQSRWLYPVLAFGYLATIELQWRAQRVLPALLAVSLLFSVISQYRSLAPTLHLSTAEIRAREEAKVKWDERGRLISMELLYVNRPAMDHALGGRLWILR